jgi:hypothetical protein
MSYFLNVDYGLRFSSDSIGKAAAFAPRLGFVYSPARTGSAVIRGDTGVFYDQEARPPESRRCLQHSISLYGHFVGLQRMGFNTWFDVAY